VTAGLPDAAAMKAHAEEWIAAFNAHDLERVLACYADDVELTSPIALARSGGRSATVRGLTAYPDLRFELVGCFAGVGSAVVHYHTNAGDRMAAEFVAFDAAGRITRVNAHYAG
jgi:hypothetical protein